MAQDKSQTQRQKLEGMSNIPKSVTYLSVVCLFSRRQLREQSLRRKGAKHICLLYTTSRMGFFSEWSPKPQQVLFQRKLARSVWKKMLYCLQHLRTSEDLGANQGVNIRMCRHVIRLCFGSTVSDDFPLHATALFPWQMGNFATVKPAY